MIICRSQKLLRHALIFFLFEIRKQCKLLDLLKVKQESVRNCPGINFETVTLFEYVYGPWVIDVLESRTVTFPFFYDQNSLCYDILNFMGSLNFPAIQFLSFLVLKIRFLVLGQKAQNFFLNSKYQNSVSFGRRRMKLLLLFLAKHGHYFNITHRIQ